MEDEDVPKPIAIAIYGLMGMLIIATIIGEIFFPEPETDIDWCKYNASCLMNDWNYCIDECLNQVVRMNATGKEPFVYYHNCSNDCIKKYWVI